jgi:ATP-dependent DNA ligase
MTQTEQPCSWASLNELGMNKIEIEEAMRLLLSAFDNLYATQENLSKLNYLIDRELLEQIINNQTKGEKKWQGYRLPRL